MKYKSVDSLWYRFFNSKLALFGLAILVILIGYSVIREKGEQQETTQNFRSLEQEISELENQSLELAAMIKYLRSDDFVEREARQKLNLQKPGEKVVLIAEDQAAASNVAGDMDMIDKRNWQLWAEYFLNTP